MKTKVKELKKSLHSAQVNTLIQVLLIKRKESVNFLTNVRFVKARSLSLAFPLSKEGASKINKIMLYYSDTRIFEATKTVSNRKLTIFLVNSER